MQVFGKNNKILLIAVAILMLVAVGVSFAMWSNITVKATNDDLSQYANAKVGDVITFGNYYQTGERDTEDPTKYAKTPIEWIVVDKDERTGQLTLMSKYTLASGSYFGNKYCSSTTFDYLYSIDNSEVDGIPYNQAYVESTARAFLNNLERKDLGGDSYVSGEFKTSAYSSDATTGKLYTSVGFSNNEYSIDGSLYRRPVNNDEYKNRPATLGFYDEAFTNDEKSMIVPKVIPGYIGYRWPNKRTNSQDISYVEGTVDKIWLPSATELGMPKEDNYTNSSDKTSSIVFEYFKNYTQYTNPVTNTANITLEDALKTLGTDFVKNDSKAMNYSIPVYQYQSTTINDDIHNDANSLDDYWTRSPMLSNCNSVCIVDNLGSFDYWNTSQSNFSVRPCVILKY